MAGPLWQCFCVVVSANRSRLSRPHKSVSHSHEGRRILTPLHNRDREHNILEVTMPERPKILVTQRVSAPAYPILEASGDVDANMQEGQVWSHEELLRRG